MEKEHCTVVKQEVLTARLENMTLGAVLHTATNISIGVALFFSTAELVHSVLTYRKRPSRDVIISDGSTLESRCHPCLDCLYGDVGCDGVPEAEAGYSAVASFYPVFHPVVEHASGTHTESHGSSNERKADSISGPSEASTHPVSDGSAPAHDAPGLAEATDSA